jgi:hypothetical protein
MTGQQDTLKMKGNTCEIKLMSLKETV